MPMPTTSTSNLRESWYHKIRLEVSRIVGSEYISIGMRSFRKLKVRPLKLVLKVDNIIPSWRSWFFRRGEWVYYRMKMVNEWSRTWLHTLRSRWRKYCCWAPFWGFAALILEPHCTVLPSYWLPRRIRLFCSSSFAMECTPLILFLSPRIFLLHTHIIAVVLTRERRLLVVFNLRRKFKKLVVFFLL